MTHSPVLLSTTSSPPRCLRSCAYTCQRREASSVQAVNLPDFWFLLDEFLHQLLAFLALHIHDLNTSFLEVFFSTKKGLVLPNYDTGNFIKNTCASTRVRKRLAGFKLCAHTTYHKEKAYRVKLLGRFKLYGTYVVYIVAPL